MLQIIMNMIDLKFTLYLYAVFALGLSERKTITKAHLINDKRSDSNLWYKIKCKYLNILANFVEFNYILS